jgi:dTDP-4-amino-4,6-dideoxygalactose transaminase
MPRRYFYPSLNHLPYVTHTELAISENVAKSILCLPLFMDLESVDLEKICSIVNTTIQKFNAK